MHAFSINSSIVGLISRSLAGVISIVISAQVVAQDALQTSLSPEQRVQVQTIGQSLLNAMRKAKPAPEAQAIAEQIKRVKHQVDLMAIAGRQPVLELQTGSSVNASVRSAQSLSMQAGSMSELRTRLDTLKAQYQGIIDERQPAESSLWQRVTRFLDQTPVTDQSPRHSVVTPLSHSALKRLDAIEGDVETAMSLPVDQRLERLRAISQQLTISKTQPARMQGTENETGNGAEVETQLTETPTFQTRTQHRRHFRIN